MDESLFIRPLTRPFTSLGDQTVLDTTVNPSTSNVTYSRPYLVNLPTSFADGKLTLLVPGAQGSAGARTNLGGLSPAAGGDTDVTNPANLSPSAGGENPDRCANAFLDSDWAKPASERCN